jgi:Cytochrome c554 and c-prime
MNFFKDAGHLLRFAGLFVIAFLLFWVIRGYVVPKTFGQYGHYRGAAITEIAAHPVKYAGHSACETCHTDVVDVKNKGKHEQVNCEACHGPQAAHADDPGSVTPAKLDTGVLCVRCHAASAARPKNFPQVEAEGHSSGVPCETCHQPHSPAIDGSAAAIPAKAAPDKASAKAAGGAK